MLVNFATRNQKILVININAKAVHVFQNTEAGVTGKLTFIL
jgi:hypothetical protein